MKFLDFRIANLDPYVPGEQPQTSGFIKLNTNESAYPPAPKVVEAAGQAAGNLQLYPDPTLSNVSQELADYLAVEPDQLFLGNGSDEILAFCFQSLMGQGVAFPKISYGFYSVFAKLYGLTTRVIPLNADLSINLADYQDLTETIVIANPNAPTSLGLPAEAILQLVQAQPERLVIVDEAYVEFGGESLVPYVKEYANLLVVGTFSKSWQLAGARLGYAVAQPALIEILQRMKYSFNPYSVNSMTAACGLAALQSRDYHEKCLNETIATRTWSKKALEKLGFEVLDSQTNFLFVKGPVSGAILYPALKERKILVRWFNQPEIKDYLRITIGTRSQMDTLVSTLKELLS
ncbi:histidinol-phosphate transaminase [Enterococcus sp. 2201sp1_2201st1_B8_2201SCRN_220225]|uniref:histidinol-phosphate transaminase n=1 Tax=unclassified Enterococcus TaxID=2608891 RepID=UPI0034A1D270